MHTILYVRQVYPAELFARRRKLGIPLFQCVEPGINSYIADILESVGEDILVVSSQL